MRFVHLHTHSHYSLLEAVPKIPELVRRVKELGMDAVALTDHGALYGAIEFYREAKKADIKPIIGMEANLAPHGRALKRPKIDDRSVHLTLLAENKTGYRNLMTLSSIGFLEGFYYRPRIDKELLRAHHEGLIALSGCLRGEIPHSLAMHDRSRAETLIREYQELFGRDNFFLELVHHPDLPMQVAVNAELIELAERTGAPLVATRDAHYLAPTDAELHAILLAIQLGKSVDELRRDDGDLSLLGPEEMVEAFRDVPEAITNTARIADRCMLELDLGKWNFPIYAAPDGKTSDSYLRELAETGLRERVRPVTPEIQSRLEHELDIITKRGFSTYFLVVSDYVRWARSQGIISTTRGSAAGSLASYAIGITTVNPLDFKLPFERFLNPSRPSPPDIDMDFADNRRDEVIAYATAKYGTDKVAQICTFGAMLARGGTRDVGRALGLPHAFCDRVAKLIPFGAQGFAMTIGRAKKETPALQALYDEDREVRRLLDFVERIEGNARHVSVHAAGVVISPSPLTEFTPLQRESGGERIITQYEMNSVEEAGLLKMDFLGIRNLSILGHAVELVRQTKGVAVDLQKLPLDDAKTFALLARGDTVGLFQLNGTGMTRYLVELKPTTIFDIMAMVALFRPGPIESIPEFIRRKHNSKLITYLDPRLEKILERSYGVITYQDDVLLTAIELAGYNWETVDKLRKAMGKKIPAEMARQKEKFITGCQEHGKLSKEKAESLWKLIEPFAAYGFNKAHAASYAIVAYQTAYMKANFPAEFMTAVLTAESGDLPTVAEVVAACRRAGIEVMPPDVNESRATFTYIDDTHIRFGLLAIKNLGEDVVASIIRERDTAGTFADLTDFIRRVSSQSFNRKSLEALIRSGAMDRFGEREMLLRNIETLLAYRRDAQREIENGQGSLFGGAGGTSPFRLREAPPASRRTLLLWEKELLGLYVSEHPFTEFAQVLGDRVVSLGVSAVTGSRVRVAGIITNLREITTKSGEAMCFARIEDTNGSVEVVVFPRVLRDSREYWRTDSCVIVTGVANDRNGSTSIVCELVWPLTTENMSATVKTLERMEVRAPTYS
ncbi:DNA polymerase III subunit alpha [Candidatus Uhrbacteria bacterium]|nr:DNA polymerase III subunit alpha [Candidatus Uhrbacteria bacterium]